MHVVEGRQQPGVLGQQQAVAEHVARHVADADAGEILRLDVGAELAEMPLDALPGAARRDAHLLVVVAGRPAGGEGIVQPEAVVARHAVGDVGEGRGALVGGDHQIGIVLVAPHHLLGRHQLAADRIVGDVEQAAHQGLVAMHHLGHHRFAVGGLRRALHHEAALGADRNDDGVLHHLRLHQAQHLGAEILAPVRPADAAARHLAAAQMDRFRARRIDEHLTSGRGSGRSSSLCESSLKEMYSLSLPSAPRWK